MAGAAGDRGRAGVRGRNAICDHRSWNHVGKSIAYLVPAVLYAVEQSKKAIISTYTISLQEQLLHKDIPIVEKEFADRVRSGADERPAEPAEHAGTRVAASRRAFPPLRSKRNCNESPTGRAPTRDEFAERSGDGAEHRGCLWGQVCSEAHICTAKTCGLLSNLFFSRHANACLPRSSSSTTPAFHVARRHRRNETGKRLSFP